MALNLESRDHFIASLISGSTTHIRNLNTLKIQLESLKNLSFYTDGSLKDRYNNSPIMGFAWVLDDPLFPTPIHFKGAASSFTSSTKAESLAILTALLVCQRNSTVTIYSDSLSAIKTFENFSSKSPRRKLKQNNFLIWHTINFIISHNNLKVSLIKVKAHSGIVLNELVDKFAKDACFCHDYIQINHRKPDLPNNLLVWNNNLVIDQDARKTIKTIQNFRDYYKFIEHSNIMHIKSNIVRKTINLKWTHLWIKYSPYDEPTSEQISMYFSKKLKYHLNQLPTTDILHRNYPKLIDQQSCFLCNTVAESNHHLWKCYKVTNYLYNAARGLAHSIIKFVTSHRPKQARSITSYINSLELFNPVQYQNGRPLRVNHPVLMMFNQLIPNTLVNIFHKYRIGIKFTKPFLLNELTIFYKYLHVNIWKFRNVHFKNFKSTHNINKQSFKDYHVMFPSNPPSSSTAPVNRHSQRNGHLDRTSPPHLISHHNDPIADWIIWTSSNFLHNGPLEDSINISSVLPGFGSP